MKSRRFSPSFSGGEYLPERVPSLGAVPAGATAVLAPVASAAGDADALAATPAAGGASLPEPIVPADPRRADRPDMARWRRPFAGALACALFAAPFALLLVEEGGTMLLLSGEDRGGEDDGEDDAGDTLEPVASDAAAAAAAFLLDLSDRIFTRLSASHKNNHSRRDVQSSTRHVNKWQQKRADRTTSVSTSA